MKLYLVDAENIYFPQIKDYFREIESSYDNGNYRSAMVMLYSTIVCDLLLKLKELNDVYSDAKAESILSDINAKRKLATNSTWEWDLIKRIKNETELLSDESFAMIHHIYDYRNISAHPAMNEEYELISPSAEITIAYIKQALKDVFVKPSVFASSIVDRMSDDIADKRDLYVKDYTSFRHYLEKAYFQRMPIKMAVQVFKAFWKFAFIKTDDELIYKENRFINMMVLEALLENYLDDICDFISSNSNYFSVSQEKECLIHICILLAFFPRVYRCLDSSVLYQIEAFNTKDEIRIIKWFLKDDMESHVRDFETDSDALSLYYLNILRIICKNQGVPSLFNKFVIKHYANCESYTSARLRFDKTLSPFLELFSADDYIEIIKAINSNHELYEYWGQRERNDRMLKIARPLLPEDFPFEDYPNFRFTEETNETESPQNDDNDRGFLPLGDPPF